jgi:hypothetical protein
MRLSCGAEFRFPKATFWRKKARFGPAIAAFFRQWRKKANPTL